MKSALAQINTTVGDIQPTKPKYWKPMPGAWLPGDVVSGAGAGAHRVSTERL